MNNILKTKNVHDYNAFIGHPDQHPLVSVIEYATVSPILHTRSLFSVYGLFLRNDTLEDLTYGCSKYDYHEGTLICVAPGQIGGVDYNGKKFQIEGWALLFHPDLLNGTPLGSRIKDFSFFSYQVNEALHMTVEERKTIISFMELIKQELEKKPDVHQDSIIVSYIELILKHCMRFYDRQFATRKVSNNDILSRFEALLNRYYETGKQLSDGIPTVQYCADQLNMSRNYFGDLVKRETDETASSHIQRHLIDRVRDKLMNGEPISQVAYDLGFEYPQHLSRLFKKVAGCTPSEYCEKIRKK